MSIATLESRPVVPVLLPQPRMREMPDGGLMTVQKRIRFNCFLTVGHAGAYLEFQCRSQAPFELEREGPKTVDAFMNRVEAHLRGPAMLSELDGSMDIEDIVTEMRYQIRSLEHSDPQSFAIRIGNVYFSGETDTCWFRRFP